MNRASLIQAGASLLIALALAGAYLWFLQETRALASEALSLAAHIEAKSGERTTGAAVRDVRDALVQNETFVASRFVPGADVVDFLEELEAVGAREGARVEVVSVSEGVGGRIELALALRGSFSSIMRAVGAIEHGPYASATKSLTLDSSEEGEWSATYLLVVATP